MTSFDDLTEQEQRDHMNCVGQRKCSGCSHWGEGPSAVLICDRCYGRPQHPHFLDRYAQIPAVAEMVSVQVPTFEGWEVVRVEKGESPQGASEQVVMLYCYVRPVRVRTDGELLEWAAVHEAQLRFSSLGYSARCLLFDGRPWGTAFHPTIQDALRALIAGFEKAERSRP